MKLNIFIILILSTLIASCAEDEPKASLTTEDKLAGTWNLSGIDYSGTTITSYMNVEATTHFTGSGYDLNYQMVFDKASKTYESLGSYSILIEFTTTGQTQTTTQKLENIKFAEDGVWELNEGKLIFQPEGRDAQEVNVEILDESFFKMSQILDDVVTQGGVTITRKIDIGFTFNR